MKTAIYNRLTGDEALMTILTGGLYDQVVEISRQGTPEAFDNNLEIKPCALLKVSSLSPVGPYDHSARMMAVLYFYERAGHENIEAAMARAYQLLHRQRLTPTGGGGCWEIRHTDDVPGQEDDALRCSLGISRFSAYIMREA